MCTCRSINEQLAKYQEDRSKLVDENERYGFLISVALAAAVSTPSLAHPHP